MWLDTDYNATWDKIYKAIECPGVIKADLNFQLTDGKCEKINSSMVCRDMYVHNFKRSEYINGK